MNGIRNEDRGDAGQDLRVDGPGTVGALLTGGDPRSLRNASLVVDDASGDWIVINLSLQALATFARISPAVRARLAGRLHRYERSRYKSVASRARKLLAEFGPGPP
jgi:hypothetical protein